MATLATSMEVAGPGGAVRLGEVELPGHVQSIEVGCDVLFDERKIQTRSGRAAQPQGYDAGQVTIRVLFLDQPEGGLSALDQVAVVDGLFKALDAAARPRVFRLVNVHTRSRGIRDVQWRNFTSSARVGRGGVEGALTLREYEPPIIKKEKAAAWKHGLAEGTDVLATGGIAGLFGAATGAGLGAALEAGGGYLRDRKVAPYRRALARGRESRTIADRVLMKAPPTDAYESREREEQQAVKRELQDDWRVSG